LSFMEDPKERVHQETGSPQGAIGTHLGQRQRQSEPEDQGPERNHAGQQSAVRVEGIRG